MSLLQKVTNAAPRLPSRVVLYAAEKFGKTSFAAQAPKPIFLLSPGETGLLSLREAGRVPPTDYFPEFRDWDAAMGAVRELRDQPHDYQSIVFDTGNGFEQLCANHVCETTFGGNWGDYNSYGKGNELAKVEWSRFIGLLDEVRTKRKMAVLLLHHAKVKAFSDPAGKTFDRWQPECIEKVWNVTSRWADVILFGGWEVNVTRDDKATSEERYLRSGATAACTAGNRLGLPDKIKAPNGAENLWKAFADAMRKAKSQGGEPAKAPAPVKAAATPAKKEPELVDFPPKGDDQDDGYAGDQTLPFAGGEKVNVEALAR